LYTAYGVDGFRFDLARILADGSTDAAAWVGADPRFARRAVGLGRQWWNFMDSPPWDWTNNRWAKWIGNYRDGARLFSKSDLRDPGKLKS
jgi:isoamylase